MASPSIAPREWAVALCGGLTLASTAWLFAGVEVWTLHSFLGGALITLLLALMPLPARANGRDGEHGNLKNPVRLLRLPFFWLSLAFLGYVAIQGLNPAWTQLRDDEGWWMERIAHIEWLPSGAETAYEPMNAFRVLSHFAAAFCLAWGLWVGLRRRQTVLFVLWAFVLSGVTMAIVAILQHLTGADGVLWYRPSENNHFWGTFFYRNQGVGYLTLVIVATAFLYFFHFNRCERRAQTGGPYLLLFVFVAVLATSIGLALSRGGVLFGGAMTLVFLVSAAGRWLFSRSGRTSIILSTIVFLVVGGGAYSIFRYIDWQAIEERFGDIEATIENADEDTRALTTEITWNMAREKLWLGWGAGSWRYIFPMYQKSYPEIFYLRYHKRKGWIGRRFFRYAHNDIMQFLYEFGVAGCALLLGAYGWWLLVLARRSFENRMCALTIFAGLVLIAGHAFFEFIFQSPAYWVALNGFLCAAVKLVALHDERNKPANPPAKSAL